MDKIDLLALFLVDEDFRKVTSGKRSSTQLHIPLQHTVSDHLPSYAFVINPETNHFPLNIIARNTNVYFCARRKFNHPCVIGVDFYYIEFFEDLGVKGRWRRKNLSHIELNLAEPDSLDELLRALKVLETLENVKNG